MLQKNLDLLKLKQELSKQEADKKIKPLLQNKPKASQQVPLNKAVALQNTQITKQVSNKKITKTTKQSNIQNNKKNSLKPQKIEKNITNQSLNKQVNAGDKAKASQTLPKKQQQHTSALKNNARAVGKQHQQNKANNSGTKKIQGQKKTEQQTELKSRNKSHKNQHIFKNINLERIFTREVKALRSLFYVQHKQGIKFLLALANQQRKEQRSHDNWTEAEQNTFLKIVQQGEKIVTQRLSKVPKLEYPEQLPVSQRIQDIRSALEKHQIIIVSGNTGSGKTTQLPKLCLEMGLGAKGYIGHTQPRRIAARSVANTIAREVGTNIGDLVGYKVRFNESVSPETQIKLMTDGILLAEIQRDKYLSQYSCLIIDEAHERSLNNDFILGYLKQILKHRPDLKIIITSATIDVEKFQEHFAQENKAVPILSVEGRTYPVEILYRPLQDLEEEQDLVDATLLAIKELYNYGLGNILIFCSGEREIRDLSKEIGEAFLDSNVQILPIYSRLSFAEQNAIFSENKNLRIILATNIAETSLTIPNIKYVIDLGYARISRYSYRSQIQRLPIEPISQASAQQRAGRCGRLSNGVCIRLYSEEDFLSRPLYTDPEILRTNLTSVVLQMLNIGLNNITSFPFLDSPDNRYITDALKNLELLGAITTENNNYHITNKGKTIARLPIDPSLASMLVVATDYNSLHELLVITTALSIVDPRERPSDKQMQADQIHAVYKDKQSDFITFLNLWNYLEGLRKELSNTQFRKHCKKHYLNFVRILEWQDLYKQLKLVCIGAHFKFNQKEATYEEIHKPLISGFLNNIGQKIVKEDKSKNASHDKQQKSPVKRQMSREYQGTKARKFNIFPSSTLHKNPPNWMVSAEIVETSKVWARLNAQINPEWIENLAQHILKYHYFEPHWSKKRQEVLAYAKISLFGLTLVEKRQVTYSQVDLAGSREIFIREALVLGNWQANYVFWQQNQKLIQEIQDLESKHRRSDLIISDDELYAFYDNYIPHYVYSYFTFNDWYKKESKKNPKLLELTYEELVRQDETLKEFPKFWKDHKYKLKLSYIFDPQHPQDGVTVHIPIQILETIDVVQFSWHIPHYRPELVSELIKTLPKQIRKQLVPAPNFASAYLERIKDKQEHHKDKSNLKLLELGKISLQQSMSQEFSRMLGGVNIDTELWNTSELESHLRIHFAVLDVKNKILKIGDDLLELRKELSGQITQSLNDNVQSSYTKKGLTTWDFASLPQKHTQKQGALTIEAYPALVKKKDCVDIELFHNKIQQQETMLQGVTKLILLNCRNPLNYLRERLGNKSKLAMHFNPFGNIADLLEDCIFTAALALVQEKMNEGVFAEYKNEEYLILLDHVRGNINNKAFEVITLVEDILLLAHGINNSLKKPLSWDLSLAYVDIKDQLTSLIFNGFVTKFSYTQLKEFPRYLKAIELRLEKMPINPQRDKISMLQVQNCQQYYQKLQEQWWTWENKANIEHVFFMIQELRVSVFAQVLGVSYAISEKRVLNYIDSNFMQHK